ncbi:hypothetical protein GGR57DRAFT_238634 [Xylariaceae sp. FL1272]|nr:hypothetical protein GGR57DRAFT_238634 [Xylariaceae sp. FL1272]
MWQQKSQLYIDTMLSPIEQRRFHPRPLRRAILLAAALGAGWFLLFKEWRSVEIAEEFVRNTSWQPGQWVGGGSVGTSSQPSNTLAPYLEVQRTPLGHDLPDVIRISFEDAVKDVVLEGWEDEWFTSGHYNKTEFGPLAEPSIDFVYNWVNGSDGAFKDIRHTYELQSPLNDKDGKWITQHSVNRYRDWDELRYSLRSLNTYAKGFVNKIQLLVNSVPKTGLDGITKMQAQRPTWLKDDEKTNEKIQVLSQEAYFRKEEQSCLPTFNSLSLETQIYNTPSDTDQLVALSDDMLLGMDHAASDFYSPLFGHVMGFKSDAYNVKSLDSSKAPSFGEKPFVYYTSYLLNHRFGQRDRHVQAHFTHSISRATMHEAMASFPGPSLNGACERFRGESRYQIYPWFAGFHYSIERFREALLWSYIEMRADANRDGYLDYQERRQILDTIQPGWDQLGKSDASKPAAQPKDRERMYFKVPEILADAGLQRPKVNLNILWTSIDGPETIRSVKCHKFKVDKCLGESFASSLSDSTSQNPDFTASNVFSRLSHEFPTCGDCLIKFILASAPRGLGPLLPAQADDRGVIVKALKKYSHTVVDTDTMKFVMVKDAEQAETELLERTVKKGKAFGQWCLNDDVMTESAEEVGQVKDVMKQVFESLWPSRTSWEL